MTTYQDPPLQSRRAARQNERGDLTPAQLVDPSAPAQQPITSQAPASYPTPESLLYATQVPGAQAPQPQYPATPPVLPPATLDASGPAVRGRRVAETPGEPAARSEAGYRVRDFSPEARRVAMQNWSQAPTNDGSLTYQTEQRPRAAAPAQEQPVYEQPVYPQPVYPPQSYEQPAAQPVVQPPAVPVVPQPTAMPASAPPAAAVPFADESLAPEFTLSRRELRALREAQEGPDAGVAPVESAPEVSMPAAQVPVAQLPAAPMAAESMERTHYADPQPQSAEQAPWAASTTTGEQVSAFEALFGGQQAPEASPVQQVQHAPQVPQVQEAAVLPPAVLDEVPTTTSDRPVGHWSRQAELDDEMQHATSPHAREVGSGAITTSALVLPEMPNHDFTRTVTSTGDVLVTGSINLPSHLSSTGATSTQLDTSDIDHMLDIGDRQVTSTDSQPVRAVKAVSTHTSSRGIINAAPPKRGNRLLTALIVSACAMLVVVVGLAVVIVLSGVLN